MPGLASPGRGGTPPPPLTSCHSPSAVPCPAGRSCPPTRRGRQPAPGRHLLRAQTAGLRPKGHPVPMALWPLCTPPTQSPLPSAHSDPTHRAAESPRGRSSPPHRRWPGRATQAQDCGRGTWRGTWGHRPHTPGPPHTAELGGEERGLGHQGARAPGSNSSGRASPKRGPWRAPGCMDGLDVLPGACQGYLQHSSDLSMFGSSRTASGS